MNFGFYPGLSACCAAHCGRQWPVNPSWVPAAPVSTVPIKRLLDFCLTPEVHDMLYFTIMGFVLDQVQPGHKERSSWVDGPGWREWRPRTERLLRVVSAGAGLTIATSMTNSHSTDTSRSLWKQNKLNNKGESWHSQPFSQLHQINSPSQIRARGRCWSPRLETQQRGDKSFSTAGFRPWPWLLLGFEEGGKSYQICRPNVVNPPCVHHNQ